MGGIKILFFFNLINKFKEEKCIKRIYTIEYLKSGLLESGIPKIQTTSVAL